MSGAFSKSMARNVFFSGTVFFFLLFLALTFDTANCLLCATCDRTSRRRSPPATGLGNPQLHRLPHADGRRVRISHRSSATSWSASVARKASRLRSRAGRPKAFSAAAAACRSSTYWKRNRRSRRLRTRQHDQQRQLAAQRRRLIPGRTEHAIQDTSGCKTLFHRSDRPLRWSDRLWSDPGLQYDAISLFPEIPFQHRTHGAHQPVHRLAALRLHGRGVLHDSRGTRNRASSPKSAMVMFDFLVAGAPSTSPPVIPYVRLADLTGNNLLATMGANSSNSPADQGRHRRRRLPSFSTSIRPCSWGARRRSPSSCCSDCGPGRLLPVLSSTTWRT